jgi:hypothetical protein
VQAGLNESLVQMPWLDPVVSAPAQPYSADQAKELREAAQRLITAAETAAKHFGYARLGGVSLEDSHVRSELHAWVADLRAALDAPAQPQGAGSLHGRPVRIAEVVSSSDPSKTVPWLAHGFVEITKVQAHSDFVRWLDAAQPQGAVDMQMRRPPRQPMR